MDDPGVSPTQPQDDAAGLPVSRPRIGGHDRDDPGREARWAAWRLENAEAIASWNIYINTHGLPLSGFSRP